MYILQLDHYGDEGHIVNNMYVCIEVKATDPIDKFMDF